MKRYFLLSVMTIVVTSVLASEGDNLKSVPAGINRRISSPQLSLDQLEKMSTEELLHSCMELPHLFDFISSGCNFLGFEHMTEEYNGFAELFRREDFAIVLLREYQDLPNQIAKVLVESESQKGALSFKYLIYEYMMTRDEFVEKMRKSQDSMNGEAIILNNYEIIIKNPEIFSSIHAIPMRKLLDIGLCNQKNKEKMSRQLSVNGEYQPVVVTTPNGTPLQMASQWIGSDYSPAEQEDITLLYIYGYDISPDSIVGPPSVKYNCHAYAWHMSNGGNQVWIIGSDYNTENGYYLSPYWEDGSYYECSQNDDHDVVLYAGGHSARYLGNGLYESKWENGPIIRHQLNNVKYGYRPDLPKRFFKRVILSMSGPTIPGSPSTYSVNNLPSGWYVVWSIQGKTTLPSYCTANYPLANQLQIDNSNKLHIEETLVAKVYMANGTLVETLTKYINTAGNFSGSYTQTIPLPYEVLSGHIYDGNSIWVKQGYDVVMTSSDFNGATVSYTSSSPYPTISTSGNTVTVRLHASTMFSNCLLHVVKGDKVIEFRLRANPTILIDPILMANISNEGNSVVNIVLSRREGDVETRLGDEESWQLVIYNYATGELVCNQQVSGSTVSIDSSKWTPGVYIVRIKMGDKEIVQKFNLE